MKIRLTFALTLLALSACSHGTSSTPHSNAWQVKTHGEDSDKLCYAGAGPVKSSGTIHQRGQAYLMVTHLPTGKWEVSASSGYPYMRAGKVEMVIDGKPHSLFFKDAVAWAWTRADNQALVGELRKGSTVEVRGVAGDGETSVDTYSLAGISAALKQVKERCK